MPNSSKSTLSPVIYIPHGGGPLPLLGDEAHREMVDFLKNIVSSLGRPSAILLISAHWEEDTVGITGAEAPPLIYDYYGFPEESYKIQYPAPGCPELAQKVHAMLQGNGVDAKLDDKRGFDHGVFVPLKIMFPQAGIPCVQLSLLKNLDAKSHIQVGKALSGLRNENVLIMGSGLSFHNMKALSKSADVADQKNEAFEGWLIDTCTNGELSENDREQKLISWAEAPGARYCHPREEHLLPLHVCYGVAGASASLAFDGKILGKRTSAFLW